MKPVKQANEGTSHLEFLFAIEGNKSSQTYIYIIEAFFVSLCFIQGRCHNTMSSTIVCLGDGNNPVFQLYIIVYWVIKLIHQVGDATVQYVYWFHVKPVPKYQIKGPIKEKTLPAISQIISSATCI